MTCIKKWVNDAAGWACKGRAGGGGAVTPPPCDTPSGCCSFTGSFPRSRSPVAGLPGLC